PIHNSAASAARNMQNASIERYFVRSDKLSFNSVKFSIEKKVEPKKGNLKRTKDNQHSINEGSRTMALQTHLLVPENNRPSSPVIGSKEHKQLFCRFFIDTHITFDPTAIEWPELDEGSLKLLHSLPVWTQAMETECIGTCTIQSCAALETDPLIREAVML